jgi:hypothetical protein
MANIWNKYETIMDKYGKQILTNCENKWNNSWKTADYSVGSAVPTPQPLLLPCSPRPLPAAFLTTNLPAHTSKPGNLGSRKIHAVVFWITIWKSNPKDTVMTAARTQASNRSKYTNHICWPNTRFKHTSLCTLSLSGHDLQLPTITCNHLLPTSIYNYLFPTTPRWLKHKCVQMFLFKRLEYIQFGPSWSWFPAILGLILAIWKLTLSACGWSSVVGN